MVPGLVVAQPALVLWLMGMSAVGGAPDHAPDRLLTRHGVDIVLDEDVFVLFAALNAAGYSRETERKGPPLVAPIFHPIRADAREALRAARNTNALKEARKVFEAHPVAIEVYLEAILAGQSASAGTAKLRDALIPVLTRFRKEAALEALFDRLAERQRTLALTLREDLDKDLGRATKLLGLKALTAPLDLVVVPNFLDGHAEARRVRSKAGRFVVVGPGFSSARAAIVTEVVAATLAASARQAVQGAAAFQQNWESLKASRRIRGRYGHAANYLAQALARAVTHRVRHPKPHRETDEDFIDDQAKQGIRWARAGLKIVDMPDRGSLPTALAAVIRRVTP